ncbi:MAG: alginate lyase family protein [Verrucomicrobia bacterium]|nr:alginate lyase family protein [Verrucomicrobiota bacterium]
MSRCAALFLFVLAPAALSALAQERPATAAPAPRIFCLSRDGLAEAKALVARDDPSIRTSFRRLVREADLALDVGPYSVVLKGPVPPSGNKHDYHSLSPYHWPDPEQPGGRPYKNRDGFTNPEWWQDYDRVPLERLVQATETLALAYTFTGREPYATRAAHLVRIWFLDPATAMTPDLVYAQAIPGTRPGHTQVIDTRFLPRLIDAVGLIGASPAWTPQDQAALIAWFREFLANVRRRADEGYRNSAHNIASFYHAQMAAMALFVGDEAQAREMIERTKPRLDKAVGPDGFFTVERRRTRSLSYSCFHLYALFNLATMGRLLEIDVWNFTTPDGRGLRRALDAVARHAGPYPPKDWPFSETGRTPGDWWDPFHDQLPSVLYHAARTYREQSYADLLPRLLGDSASVDQNRLHLLCGLPLPGQQSLDGWLFHPSPASVGPGK